MLVQVHHNLLHATTNRLSRWADRNIYVILFLPAVLVMVTIFIFPLLYSGWMSLYEFTLGSVRPPTFVGLRNYLVVMRSERFINSLAVTVYNLVLSIAGALVLGMIGALIFHQRFPGRGLARAIAVFPAMATPAAIALLMVLVYHPSVGVANYLLSLVGISPQMWTYSPRSAVPSLALIQIWQYAPLAMLFMLGGLAVLPEEPYEAAVVDGATSWQRFRYLTVPLLRPHIFLAAIVLTIDLIKAFEVIYIMTGGGPGVASETLNLLLYFEAFQYYRLGHASALGLIFLAIIMVLTGVLVKLRRG